MNSRPCPLPSHKNSTTCCGRGDRPERGKKSAPKWKYVAVGVREYPDGHIERTPSAKRRRKDELLRRDPSCAACAQPFADYRDIELGHVESTGMNGWKRDDSDNNLRLLLHRGANQAQGSMPFDEYMKSTWRPSHCNPNFKGEN